MIRMKAMKRTLSVGCLLLVLSLFLCTACGGGDEEEPAAPTVCVDCSRLTGVDRTLCLLENARISGC